MAPVSAPQFWSVCNEAWYSPSRAAWTAGAGYFPARLICPKCGNADWRDDAVHDGVVEQTTIVRHAAGRADWQPRHIASIRTSDGQLIVAGLEEPLPEATQSGAVRQRRRADRAPQQVTVCRGGFETRQVSETISCGRT